MGQHQIGVAEDALVTNQPTLVLLLFGTAIPTSLNNFRNCILVRLQGAHNCTPTSARLL